MRLIRAPEVQNKCGFKRTTLYRMTIAGEFPQPVQITGKAIGWREEEVDQWIAERELVALKPRMSPAEYQRLAQTMGADAAGGG